MLTPLAEANLGYGLGHGSSSGQAVGSCGRPKKPFGKRELLEAVRKIGPLLSTSASAPHFDLGTAGGAGSKDRRRKPHSGGGAGVDVLSQLRVVETGVETSSRRYNDLKLQAERKSAELQSKLDTLAMLKVEVDALKDMKRGNTEDSKSIKKLQKRIAEEQVAIEARQHYQRVLAHMLRRLDSNHVNLHTHLNGMEEVLESVTKEEERVEQLMHQLEAGAVRSLQLLQEGHHEVELARSTRRKEHLAKSMQANTAKGMEAWRLVSESTRVAMAQNIRGDLSFEDEQRLLARRRRAEEVLDIARAKYEDRAREVASMEEMFAKLRQVTGTATLQEMLTKIGNQATTKEGLEREKMEVERKATAVKRRKEMLEQSFRDMKASGIGTTELNRSISDALNAQIAACRAQSKVHRAEFKRFEQTLVGVRQGSVGLCERLGAYGDVIAEEDRVALSKGMALVHESHAANHSENGQDNERITTAALSMSEAVLTKMLEANTSSLGESGRLMPPGMNGGDDESNQDTGISNGEISPQQGVDQVVTLDDSHLNLKNNVRVPSQVQRSAAEGGSLFSSSILSASITEAESETESGDLCHGGEGTAVSELESDDEKAVEDMVPSRQFLKLVSHRQRDEVMRKQESEVRKKAAESRADGKVPTSSSKRKQQEEHMKKIAIPTPSVGLPKGVSQRDDVYAKSSAFLTQVPQLE
jgi:hypothetical protein